MASDAAFAEIATLAGDPARACMLNALMDGRSLTATELARGAGIAPQTASGHLSRLTVAGLIAVEKQGRHRYHRLASPAVARMLESIMQVAEIAAPSRHKMVVGPRDAALRAARTCYDHLAGNLGVALTDAMVARGYIELANDAGVVTGTGVAAMRGLGISLDTHGKQERRALCRPCLDWSERRPHLAGRLGAELCRYFLDAGWISRIDGTRAVAVTQKGKRGFREVFGVDTSGP